MSLRKRSLGVNAAVLATALVMFLATVAGAVHDEGFALQGDVNHASLLDWVDLFCGGDASSACTPPASQTSGLPGGFTVASFRADHEFPNATAYATGSKDDLRIGDGADGNAATGTSSWQCKRSNNIGAKFNLLNSYAAAMKPTSGPSAGDTIIYFGSEIESPNGSRNAGVWLLQDQSVGCVGSGGGGTNFSGQHRDGDVFIVSAFTNGGTQSNVTVYEWVGTDASGSLQQRFTTGELNDAECDNATINDPPISDRACAIVNKAAEVNPPWTAPDADGGNLNVNEFYEGAINLSELGLNECFSTVLANTRSSHEPGSTIHDYAFGTFQTCNPSTTMLNRAATASPSTVHTGETVTLKFYEKNDGDTPLTAVSVTTDNAGCNATITKTGGDTTNVGVLDVGEEWEFTCTTSFATSGSKTVTATGTGTSPLGVVTFCPTADPTKVCDAQERTSVSITVINPSTELTKTASVSITYTYKEKNDGDAPLTAVSISDNNCSPVVLTAQAGVTDDNELDPGETWTFTCTATLAGPLTDTGTATVTNVAIGTGTDPSGRVVTFCASPDPTKVCDDHERDRVTVTITNHARGPNPA